ncbi:hypothetical protein KL906_004105 [Ogataea polymorpha]|nr:hypothetical protein KL906_004105 [Ogataea polymorpha]
MSAREGAPTELPLSMKTKSPESFLFTSLLKLVLGEQAAYVFGILLDHKRLTLPQLHKMCKMKMSAVKKSLVSLLQLECAVYFEETNFITDKTQTYYSCSFSGCYKFLYANAIINDIHRDYSELHAAVVQQVLVNGHLTTGEYLKNVDGAAQTETEKAFSILVLEKWLVPIDEMHFQSKYDLFHKVYQQQTAIFNAENKGKVISQAKKLQVIKEETRRKHQQLMGEDKLRSRLFLSDSSSMFQKVNPDIPLTFSLDRYLKRLRSLHFASEARHKVGEISSRIYALILNRLEAKSADVENPELRLEKYLANVGQSGVGLDPRVVEQIRGRYELKDQERGMNITVNEVYKELVRNGEKFGVTVASVKNTIADPSLEFGRKRKTDDHSSGFPGVKKVKIEVDEVLERLGSHESDDENQYDDADNPDPRIMSTLMQHLKLLAADPKFPFLAETDLGQFHVPYTRLSPILAKHVFKQYVKAIIGPDALKVLNCIEDKRLTDEKAVSKLVLMKEASVRSILSRLLRFNIIELQEIPKTQDRSAMRSVYAFRFKPQPAIQMFKKSILFNMGEVLEKLEQYKKQNKILLDKVNREDVKGREQELLLPSELKQLEQYYEYESTWITKLGRLRTAIDVFEFLTA